MSYVPIQYPGFKLSFRGLTDFIALHPEMWEKRRWELMLHNGKNTVRLENTLRTTYKAFSVNGKTVFPE